MPTSVNRCCIRCGKAGPFASRRKFRCIDCDRQARDAKRAYLRLYHRARSRAMTRLIHAHQDEYDEILNRELKKVRQEEFTGRARG